MYNNNAKQTPAQKKSIGQKGPQWRKDNIDAAEEATSSRHEGLRKSYRNKQINYDLYSDILDPSDIEQICNPFKLQHLTAPANIQNYPIANPKIDLLVGESLKRKLDYRVRVINEDAISSKSEELKDAFMALMVETIQAKSINEEDLKKKLERFEQFKNYDYQDLRERRATQILKYLYHKLHLSEKFSKGFKDALIAGEEIYQVDVIAGEPVVERLNPKNVKILRSGASPYFEDADVITIAGYYSPGKIIDDYHDELTPGEIDQIETGSFTGSNGSGGIDIGEKKPINIDFTTAIDSAYFENGGGIYDTYDADGNIRVLKVYWKSRRKMLKVTSIDNFGDEVVELEDEHYVVNKEAGQSSKVLWINEWWEGHKIGGSVNRSDESAIYVRMRPRPIQFRSMDNPSKCSPGIVGTIYQTNDNSSISLMDRMRPYQYMYNVLMRNTEIAISKNLGKIMSLDLARIPENWEIDEWLSMAQGMNLAVVDSFKESKKGEAMGKLAGQTNAPTPVIDLEMGNTIQLYIQMMQYVKTELGNISGISESRQGQIESREAVGNVQREVTQSSHITEYWFAEHEACQLRVLEALVETAKYAWKDKKSKVVQFVLDDGATDIFELDGKQFNEVDYGISIIGASMNDGMRDTLKQMAQAGLQNQLLNFSQLIDILSTDSVATIKRKMQKAEEDKAKLAQENQAQAERMQQAEIAHQADLLKATRDFDMMKQDKELADNQKNRDLELYIKELELNVANTQKDSDGKLEQLRIQATKINNDKSIADKDHEEKRRNNMAKEHLEEKKIAAMKNKASIKK